MLRRFRGEDEAGTAALGIGPKRPVKLYRCNLLLCHGFDSGAESRMRRICESRKKVRRITPIAKTNQSFVDERPGFPICPEHFVDPILSRHRD